MMLTIERIYAESKHAISYNQAVWRYTRLKKREALDRISQLLTLPNLRATQQQHRKINELPF